jgi:hypothetical protein
LVLGYFLMYRNMRPASTASQSSGPLQAAEGPGPACSLRLKTLNSPS